VNLSNLLIIVAIVAVFCAFAAAVLYAEKHSGGEPS
jgi:hypothetical protein